MQGGGGGGGGYSIILYTKAGNETTDKELKGFTEVD